MAATRNEKLAAAVKQYASEYVGTNAGGTSIITISNCTVSDDGKTATLFFTSIPESKEQAALGFMKRHRGEIRDHIRSRVSANIPFIEVAIDLGEKNRQHIDQLLRSA